MQLNRAKTQLKSWLKAVDIPFQDYTSYILVQSESGNSVPLCFDAEPLLTGHILINKDDVVNKKMEKSLDFFTNLQKQLGYVPKDPVNRGAFATKKSNDFDLIAFRHYELRKCPNPDPKKLKYYKPVIDIAVNKFYGKNTALLAFKTIDKEDLFTYANIWTINFIGLYELPVRGDDQNKKLLMQYLKQRFYDLVQQLNRKEEVKLSYSGAAIPFLDVIQNVSDENVTPQLPKKYYSNKLNDKLSNLDHDKMVEVLMDAINNEEINFDARKEASKRLHAHSLACTKCSTLNMPSVGGDLTAYNNRPLIDQNGVIYENPADAAKKLDLYASNIRAVLNGKYSQTGGYSFTYATQSVATASPEMSY
jgi:hypothetical protein